MTAGLLAPGDRLLDEEDGDLFVIDVIEQIDGNQLALINDEMEVLVVDRDELLFLDEVLPRVWRTKPDHWGGTIVRQVEHVMPGETVRVETLNTRPITIEVMGILAADGVVTLYERGEPVVTLDRGTLVEVER